MARLDPCPTNHCRLDGGSPATVIGHSQHWIPRYHGDGSTTYEWSYDVARLTDRLLDCVFYLYPSREMAEQGRGAGGTGFFVAIRSKVNKNQLYVYAVTNSHVVKNGTDNPEDCLTLRLNARDGTWRTGPTPKEMWVHHPAMDDIAVFGIRSGINVKDLAITWVYEEQFATKEAVEKYEIGPGDAVCMIGRFVNHEGTEKNLPSVRFGNISMMPWQPIKHEWGFLQESYLVECRSLPGYSGSPVFVHEDAYSIGFTRSREWREVLLLGIDWCHPTTWSKVVEEKDPSTGNWVRRKDMRVGTNTGMAGVIPAWKIREVLDGEPFVSQREENEKHLQELSEEAMEAVSLDVSEAEPPSEEFTKQVFVDALKKVSKKQSDH